MDCCVSEKRPFNELVQNAEQLIADGHAGVTIKSEPYDPSYDAFQTSFCQVQQDSCPLLVPQTRADSSNSAGEVKQEWDWRATTHGVDISDSSPLQNKIVKTELENHLLVTQADVELTNLKDEVITDEEKAETHKELQESDDGLADPKDESSVSKDPEATSDQNQLKYKRPKTSRHTAEAVRKCLQCQKQFDNEDEFHRHFFKVFPRLENPPSYQNSGKCAELKNRKKVKRRSRPRLEDPPSCQKSGKCAELKRKKVKCRTNLMHKKQMSHISKDCRKVFKTKEALTKHLLDKQTKGKVCQEKFESKLDSVDHLLIPEENECSSFSNSTAENKDDLANHSLSHDNTKAFICKQCLKAFGTIESLATHTCDLEQCSLCLMMFRSKQQLQEHMKLHNISEGQKVCLECKITFMTRNHLSKHLRNHHKDGQCHCRKCDKICGRESELKLHNCSKQTSSKNNEKHYCKQCNMEFNSWSDIVSHGKTHQFKCNICSKKFLSQYMLSKHAQNCTESSVGSNSSDSAADQNTNLNDCNSCQMTFKSKDLLLEHMKFCHNARFECSECGLQFDTLSEIQMHKCDAQVYKCQKCTVTFDTLHFSPQFAAKQKSVVYNYDHCSVKMKEEAAKDLLSPNDNAFVHKLCKKTYDTKESLTTHVCDTEECNMCMKSFSSKHQLQEHMKLHNINEGHRVCLECEIIFPSHEKHGEHMRTYHKDISCKKCKRTFKYKSELDLHKCSIIAYSTYDGVPFCEECNLSWTDAISYPNKTHMYVCGMCSERFMSLNTLTKHMNECEGSSVKAGTSSDLGTYEKSHLCKCCQCTAVLKSKDSLLEHRSTEHLVPCTHSCECFRGTAEFYAHYAVKHNDHQQNYHKNGPFACKVCNKIFANKSGVMLHSCSGDTQRKEQGVYFCEKCILELTSWPDVISHWNKIHIYRCPICKKEFLSPNTFARHQKCGEFGMCSKNTEESPHTSVKPSSSLKFAAKQKSVVYKHGKFVKMGVGKCREGLRVQKKDHALCSSKIASKCKAEPFCEKCKLGFKSSTDAISHQNKTHIYVCGMCSKRFMSPPVLRKHMKECKGMNMGANTPFRLDDDKVYLYKCSCSLMFRSKDMLLEHMKVCVTKELINQCSVCGLQFDSLSEMQMHRRNSHAHKCDKCGLTFVHRSQFEKHVASVHAESIYDGGARVCDVASNETIRKNIRQYGSGKGTKSNLGITSSAAEVILPN